MNHFSFVFGLRTPGAARAELPLSARSSWGRDIANLLAVMQPLFKMPQMVPR